MNNSLKSFIQIAEMFMGKSAIKKKNVFSPH